MEMDQYLQLILHQSLGEKSVTKLANDLGLTITGSDSN